MVHKIFQKNFRLRDGNELSIFYNSESGLIVLDKIRKDGLGGNEFFRRNVKDVKLPTKRELDIENAREEP